MSHYKTICFLVGDIIVAGVRKFVALVVTRSGIFMVGIVLVMVVAVDPFGIIMVVVAVDPFGMARVILSGHAIVGLVQLFHNTHFFIAESL